MSDTTMKRKGRCFVFGDNVNTDEIIPARYLSTSDPAELALYCMEDARSGFGRRDDLAGSIMIAGENFGCGSSREHAPISIKASGIGCVIAKSFARIFLRNSFNIGLPIIELPEADQFGEGDEVEIDFDRGLVRNLTKNKEFTFNPYPEFLKKVIDYGGWLSYAKAELMKEGA
ncbi:3-isopropylmalate dehydratase small subunit [Sediminispirochaeta smaragdinae]|uniref:3-isopropylmalate dehydratase small subunit n=1 Tax=Sediminispirochaeta smaragdinae (strain DSM 11293 / JCM 15392 / SEBR 4228) TaxID=573413 RepID=E1R5X3_SEDSS|nr:3-isopropylmalate dehydratase small subunit [Sediminispirochaeta smaragdinae]ADK80738.1 3-isopropylmalate dehydratase, small subunit [Sediminispirochaeta smaragdinae DSM 11293]